MAAATTNPRGNPEAAPTHRPTSATPSAAPNAAPSQPGLPVATRPAAVPAPNKPAQVPAKREQDRIDREFLPAAIELLETPPSPVRIAGIWLICAIVVTALTWGFLGRMDIHAVAQGRITPAGRSKVVQPLAPGRVTKIAVENGSRVQAGDLLIELDPTETGADREAQRRELIAMRSEIARRRVAIACARSESMAAASPIVFPPEANESVRLREESVLAADLAQLASNRATLLAQVAEHEATRNRLTASINARQRVLDLAQERVDMRTTLNDKGALSRALVIDSLQQFEGQRAAQVGEQGQLVETEASLKTLARKIEEATTLFIADQTQKLAEAARKADRVEQDLVKAEARNDDAQLRAPVAGTVQQLAVTTIGQVVTTGQQLLTLVPNDGPVEIEAMVQNKDIGFVEPGQQAVVKVEPFPFSRYGTVDGIVAKVSRDAVDDREAAALSDATGATRPGARDPNQRPQNLVFPTTINILKPNINIDGKEIPLTPGMAVTVEIRTGTRRAIDYVLSPLREVSSTWGHER